MARPKGFEPLTPRFVVWCSIQLSYGRVFARAENLCITTPDGKSWRAPRVGGFWPRPAPAVFASRKGCRRFQVPDAAGYIYKCAPRALRVPVLPQEIAHEPAKSNAHTGNSPTCRILCPCP